MKRPVLAALAALLVLPLAACTKPSPGVSVTSGTSTAHAQAICWSFDGAPIDAATCGADVIKQAEDSGGVKRVTTLPGQTIGISVDPVVADGGWFPAIGGQRLVQEPITSTYYRFQYPNLQELPAGGQSLEIVAVNGDSTRGFWVFALDAK